jgi:hypothetical protein
MRAIVQTLSRRRLEHAPTAALPFPPNGLIGRDDEYAEIMRALSNSACRLLTLVGPGGVGKTRLALHVAAGMSSSAAVADRRTASADAVIWAPFASVTDPANVPSVIAAALNYPLHGTAPPAQQLLDLLYSAVALARRELPAADYLITGSIAILAELGDLWSYGQALRRAGLDRGRSGGPCRGTRGLWACPRSCERGTARPGRA